MTASEVNVEVDSRELLTWRRHGMCVTLYPGGTSGRTACVQGRGRRWAVIGRSVGPAHARRTRPASPGSPRRRHVHGSPATAPHVRLLEAGQVNARWLRSPRGGSDGVSVWHGSEVVVVQGIGRYLGRFGVRNVTRIPRRQGIKR
jgi:hypothetical protein